MDDAAALQPVALDVEGGAGVRLRIWDYGGAGVPLLLCHCAGTCGRCWEPVIRLLGAGFRVLAPDLRGHGDSDKPRGPGQYAWELFGDDVLSAVEGLGLRGALAVGHSGGGAAVALAQLERPGLFDRIVLMDAIIATADFFPRPNPMAEHARHRKGHFESRGAVRARLRGKQPYAAWTDDSFDAYLAHGFEEEADGSVRLKCPGTAEAHWYEAGSSEFVLHRMSELALPVLLVSGTDSYMLGHVREQHRRVRGARLEVFDNTGHFIPQERPRETARLLAEWFR